MQLKECCQMKARQQDGPFNCVGFLPLRNQTPYSIEYGVKF